MKNLLLSRKFWTLILTLLVLVVSSNNPNFELDVEVAAGYVIIAVSYMIGVAIDPGPGGWRGVLQSRKFWAAVVGFAVMTLEAFGRKLPFELTPEQLVAIAVAIGGYIAGVAFEAEA